MPKSVAKLNWILHFVLAKQILETKYEMEIDRCLIVT